MTRNRLFFFVLSAALVLPICAGAFLAAGERADRGQDSFYKYLSVFTEVLGLVRNNYVEGVDEEALMAGAFDGATDALDPFSLYIPPDEAELFLAAREVGSRHSGLEVLKERGVLYVAAVDEGSPAAEAGVRHGDIIAMIDGEETRLMPLWRVQETLAARDRRLELKLLRLGEPVEVGFQLGPFAAPEVGLRRVREVPVLRIPTFTVATPAAVERALAGVTSEEPRVLLVDLRGVAGGDPAAAYAVAGLLVRGTLGSLRARGETVESFASSREPIWEGRVAVLVNRGTRGPAELLATALRQSVAAELVGERTFGYAGRQDLAQLSTGGRLLYTDAFYTGPDGEPLRDSLRPDLRVDERSRSLADTDAPLEDLILERGVELLLGEAEVPAKKAA